ncbi:MAG TPA: biotin/lipoyl-containing protein, partial [Baekduia sp.]
MAVEAATIEVTLPAMGESVTEGTILEWHKQEGETIEADEIIVEVSTDKVDAEVPAPASGTIVKIHFAEGDTVAVGSVLAEIAVGAGDGGSPNGSSGNGSSPSIAEEAPATDDAPGEIVDITTPAGGESVTEGTILEWSVKVGDAVADGDTIVEISTDKVDMELPAPAAGTITELLVDEGATVVVGQVIARMQLGAGAAASVPASGDGAGAAAAGNGAPAAGSTGVPDATKVSPVAARVAAHEGVDLAGVAGTGPQGRIVKGDVLEAKANGGTSVGSTNGATATTGKNTVLKGAAAMLARYMDDSREIPTATSFRTITVTTMDARRKQLKEAGQKVSFTHLIA